MTVANSNARSSYAGDGSSVAFATGFEFDAAADIRVVVADAAGVETVKTLTTHYTVTGGSGAVGTVTMLVAPASGETLTLLRRTTKLQTLNLVANGDFPAESIERVTDKLTRIAQEQAADADRGLRAPESESALAALPPAASRAAKLLGFDGDGKPIAIAQTAGPTADYLALVARSPINVRDPAYGASASKTTVQNKAALQAAIAAVDGLGGGTVIVPAGIDYGFKNTDDSTYPSFTGRVNDIIVIDEGVGDADGSGNKAGAQRRTFYYTAQTTPPGNHDGNGERIYGNWHPYFAVMNTATIAAVGDPSRTAYDNRRASILFENAGRTTSRLGQGTLAGAGYTNEELSNAVWEHYQTPGDTLADYAMLVIQRKTGNWSLGGGTNDPAASYHFKSVTGGYAQAMFESLGTTAFISLRTSNGSGEDAEIRNVAGDFQVRSLTSGVAMTIKGTTRKFGFQTTSPTYQYDFNGTLPNDYMFNFKNGSATNGHGGIIDSASAGASSWYLLRAFSLGQTDQEFYLRGDGNAAADGSWAGGGADYAESFEWADGNPDKEDRRGWVVKFCQPWETIADLGAYLSAFALAAPFEDKPTAEQAQAQLEDTRQIRCVDGVWQRRPGNAKIERARWTDDRHDIIGSISGNPSVVGDAAPMRWAGKYLRDDFGTQLSEEYEAVSWIERVLVEPEKPAVPASEQILYRDDGDGVLTPHRFVDPGRPAEPARYDEIPHSYATDAVPQGVVVPEDAERETAKRRILNPDFDPSTPYEARADRPEWDWVGLVGKLRTIKGQPVDPRWRKMRDISATVEEWLVR